MLTRSSSDMFSPSWFLVLDRLHGTLFEKIEGSWKTHLDELENSMFVWDRATKLKTLWRERMRVMKDLAVALSYLHDKKIIYRDLKPGET
jgi:serine/threonine protein kinase